MFIRTRTESPVVGFPSWSGVRAGKRWNYKKGQGSRESRNRCWCHQWPQFKLSSCRSLQVCAVGRSCQSSKGWESLDSATQVTSFWLNAFRRLWLFRFILKKFFCLSTTQVSWVFQLGMGKGVVLLNSCPSWIPVDILLLSSPGYFRKCPEARESLQCRVSVYERLLMCNRS